MATRSFSTGWSQNGTVNVTITYDDVTDAVLSVAATNNSDFPIRALVTNPRNGQQREFIQAARTGTVQYTNIPNGTTFRPSDDGSTGGTNIKVQFYDRWEG